MNLADRTRAAVCCRSTMSARRCNQWSCARSCYRIYTYVCVCVKPLIINNSCLGAMEVSILLSVKSVCVPEELRPKQHALWHRLCPNGQKWDPIIPISRNDVVFLVSDSTPSGALLRNTTFLRSLLHYHLIFLHHHDWSLLYIRFIINDTNTYSSIPYAFNTLSPIDDLGQRRLHRGE